MIEKTIGIPKGLLYHDYHIHWEEFFKILGFKVKVSPDTNQEIVNAGIMSAVDEVCLPVKVHYGHVIALAREVDYLFLPRIVSLAEKEYMCPKLLGLPDMLKASLPDLPCLIDPTINLRIKKNQINQAIKEICTVIKVPEKDGKKAWVLAGKLQRQYEHYLESGNLPPEFNTFDQGYSIALLGHGYNVYDQYTNLGMIRKLQRLGATVRTKEMVPKDIVNRLANQLPKKMFWTFGKQLIGSGLYYLNNPEIRGIIFVSSFGCGPDSMVGELLERWARRNGKKPFMFLTIDEHSGEAGLVTRLEAFMDMIGRRVS